MFRNTMLAVAAAFAVSVMPSYAAEPVPPSDSLPLSVLIKALEKQKAGMIVHAKFAEDLWHIDIIRDGAQTRVSVDPKTGDERKRKVLDSVNDEVPAASVVMLSDVVKKLENEKKGHIVGFDFKEGHWKFKMINGGDEAEVNVDQKGEPAVIK